MILQHGRAENELEGSTAVSQRDCEVSLKYDEVCRSVIVR